MAASTADAKHLKRESSFQESSPPKRAKQSQDVVHNKAETDDFVKKSDSDDSEDNTDIDDDEPDGAPPDPSVPTLIVRAPVLLQDQSNELSDAKSIVNKMHKINEFDARARGCRKEISRIADEMSALEERAPDLVKDGSTKWLLARVATLGAEKQAVQTVLDNTLRKQLARKRKAEKARRKEIAQKQQLEAKRLSNKHQIKSEGGKNVPQVDLTKETKVNPDAKPESLKTLKKVERRCIIKKELDVEKEPKIKQEPKIKLEEE